FVSGCDRQIALDHVRATEAQRKAREPSTQRNKAIYSGSLCSPFRSRWLCGSYGIGNLHEESVTTQFVVVPSRTPLAYSRRPPGLRRGACNEDFCFRPRNSLERGGGVRRSAP